MTNKLTPKQKAFCEYYLQSFNATEAALKAGYSSKTASEMGYENLNKPHIKQYIEKVNRMATNNRILNIEQIKEIYSDIAMDIDKDDSVRLSALDKLSRYVGITASEEMKYKNEAKRLELEEKRLELLLAKEAPTEETDTGVVMIPSVDLEAYEKEKEAVLKGLENG